MIHIPSTIKEVYNRLIADFKSYNKKSQPAVKNSWIGAILIALAGRVYDIYQRLGLIIFEIFPDSATGIYLERWGNWVGIVRRPATKSVGTGIFTGQPGSRIAKDTEFAISGIIYKTLNSTEITHADLSVASYHQDSDIVTLTFSTTHNLGTGMTVQINNQGSYNVEVLDEFRINITSVVEMTGVLVVNLNYAYVKASPTTLGVNTNQTSGTTGNTTTTIEGVDKVVYTDYIGFTGGQDVESDASLRARIIYRYQNPVTNFNVAAIVTYVSALSNVGKVKVYEITPEVGQVTIYFTLSDGSLPSLGKIESVKDDINLYLKPANTDPRDVFVYSAIKKTQDIKINNLLPNSVTLKDAIKTSLTEYFSLLGIESQVLNEDLIAVIKGTVDLESGQQTVSFDLVFNDFIPAQGEIGILGEITFD